MIGGLIVLDSFGIVGGGTVGNLLYQLQNMGVFSYVLPFLMIFAIIFAILEKTNFIGSNRGIKVILSLAVALMSLQFNFVSYFFAEIFPRMGVLLSIILVAIILLSLFLDFDNKIVKVVIGGLVFIGFLVIVYQSFSDVFPWGSLTSGPFWWWLQDNLSWIIVIALVVGGIFAVIGKGDKKGKKFTKKDFEDMAAK